MYMRNRVRCVDMFLEFEQGSELAKYRSDGPTGRTWLNVSCLFWRIHESISDCGRMHRGVSAMIDAGSAGDGVLRDCCHVPKQALDKRWAVGAN